MARTLHTVILAGGSGTRFWPLSRELSPKQMLDVFGDTSLIVSAIERAASVMDEKGVVHIVVGEGLLDEIRNHIKSNRRLDTVAIDYIVEPVARNTAPALALAAAMIAHDDPHALVLMLPSDHICQSGPRWEEAVRAAVIRAHGGDLVTIGLVPTRAETGYGYILKGAELLSAKPGEHASAYKADRFIEKPDALRARELSESGAYLWNSGMLVAGVDTIIRELRLAGTQRPLRFETEHSGQMATIAETAAHLGRDSWSNPVIVQLYGNLHAVSFDKAVLEVSSAVSVVPAELEWSDVGSLTALETLAKPDARGNRLMGRSVDVDSTNILTFSDAGESSVEPRMIATLGLENIMVIDTPDATLIADRDRAQDVRLVVEALHAAHAPEVVRSRTSMRPWGSWTMLVRAKGFHVKEVDVLPGTRLSLQSHEKRAEHWIVIEGEATVTRGDENLTLAPNESIFLPIGVKHRLENRGHEMLRLVEVATGDYLGEDDIERFDDDFGR